MIVEELVAVLGYDLRGEGDLRKFNQGIKGAERRLAAFAAAATRYGAIAGAAIGAGVTLLGRSIINTSAQFESFQATLEVLEGSSEKAKSSLEWIKTFGKTTPYEVSEVTEAFVRLRSYGIDPMDGTLRSIGDASSAMGKSLMQGVEALADAATGEFERLKEFGVRASVAGDDVTFSWQENGKMVTKTVKKNASEITGFLKTNFNRFQGAMDKQSRTWNGVVSNLKDTWTQFLLTIGEAGAFDFAKTKLTDLMDWIKARTDDGSIQRWAENISSAFMTVANVIGFVAGRIMKDGAALIDFFSKVDPAVFYAIAAAFGLLMIYLFPISWALAAVVVALDDILEWWSGGQSRFGQLIDWIKEMTGASQGLATALAAVAASLLLIAGIKVFSLLKGIGNLFKGIGGGIADELGKPGPRSGGMIEWIKQGIGPAVSAALAAASINYGESDASKSPEEKRRMDYARQGIKDRFRPQTTGGPARYRATGPAQPYGAAYGPALGSPEAVNQGGGGFTAMLANMNANLARLSSSAGPGATITDARQDNRSFPVTVAANTTINVTQAAMAGAAAVGAVSAAVGQAAAAQASRINAGPASP